MATAAVLSPSSTPHSYHRIVSSTLQVPTDHKFSIPVGLLACQRAYHDSPTVRHNWWLKVSAYRRSSPARAGDDSGQCHRITGPYFTFKWS